MWGFIWILQTKGTFSKETVCFVLRGKAGGFGGVGCHWKSHVCQSTRKKEPVWTMSTIHIFYSLSYELEFLLAEEAELGSFKEKRDFEWYDNSCEKQELSGGLESTARNSAAVLH